MTDARPSRRSRRAFMKNVAACGAAVLTATRGGDVRAEAQTPDWTRRIGLEL
jgi:hypothetical protein